MAYPETSPILDFVVVDTHNTLTLGLADTSFYPTNFNVINPTFEITPPSFPKVAVTFTKGTLTVFNSNSRRLPLPSHIIWKGPLFVPSSWSRNSDALSSRRT
jgi:hypothetical protein